MYRTTSQEVLQKLIGFFICAIVQTKKGSLCI
nr:MAG TPA: hypothetical protein [Caudoviricetes sp.]